ncbi:MAG: NADH-quinone oxidoreductase subunit NuoE [Desulfobacterales bacterium]|nr:MAG: NADH-quinone oxidoreductase subunit NuoE [Desulfobacterales bacterium]
MKLGAYDYLPKPFTEEEIKSAVKGALSEKRECAVISEPEAGVAEEVPTPPEQLPEDKVRIAKAIGELRLDFAGHKDELIQMLQRVQNRLGYLPELALQEIARMTQTPPASVYGIATFYEQFRQHPAGKHLVRVCRGTACHVKGAERILNEIKTRFQLSPGQTTRNRKFTLETVACFGSCAIAPVLVVDETVKGRMNPSKTRMALEKLTANDDEQPSAGAPNKEKP